MGPQQLRYKHLRRRMRRSLYYGPDLRMDSLSLPLTELAAAYFDKRSPFDYLDLRFATHLNREACIHPSSLIVAMVYLERLRTTDKEHFEATDPNDLYLATLVLASKWLHDDGERDFVYNDEWAASAQKELAALNRLELDTLRRLPLPTHRLEDWKLGLSQAEFEERLGEMETEVAALAAAKRSWTTLTYTELATLFQGRPVLEYLVTPVLAALGLASLLYTSTVLALTTLVPALLTAHAAVPATPIHLTRPGTSSGFHQGRMLENESCPELGLRGPDAPPMELEEADFARPDHRAQDTDPAPSTHWTRAPDNPPPPLHHAPTDDDPAASCPIKEMSAWLGGLLWGGDTCAVLWNDSLPLLSPRLPISILSLH